MILRSRLFWKFFISITLMVLITSILSVTFENYVAKHQSPKRINQSIHQLLDFRESLFLLLADEQLDEAAELLNQSVDYTQQFLVFDANGNEILGRERLKHPAFRSHFYQTLSVEFEQRGIALNSAVNSYLGNVYYVEINPIVLFRPLFSPRLAGSVIRILLLITLSAIVCYALTRALTKRIRHLQQATQEIASGNYPTVISNTTPSRQDELGQLVQDFQQMADQLQEHSAARQQILSDISHELRSPLARMQVALEIARDNAPQANSHLDRIEKESNRMNDLIGQIIHLQQTQMGNAIDDSEYQTLSLDALITDIIADVEYEYQQQHKRIEWKKPDKSVYLTAHAEQLASAIENLLRNAISHTQAGTIVNVVLVSQHPQITLTISDHGEGVATADLDKIFQPFVRLDNSRNRQTGGFGLGLSIAKAIIKQHHGSIHASHRQDGQPGLTMTVRLPNKTLEK